MKVNMCKQKTNCFLEHDERPCFENVEVSLYFKKRCYKEGNGCQDETGLKQLMNGDGYAIANLIITRC